MKVYYGHSKRIYNTPHEDREYKFIKSSVSGTVICPNRHIGDKPGIEPYLALVRKMDLVVLSEYEKYFGKGGFARR